MENKSKSFVELYHNKPWDEIFKDSTPIPLNDDKLEWINIPDEDFASYVINRTRLPFEGIPWDGSQFNKEPTYMMSQMHRLWITAGAVRKYLINNDGNVLLDLGAFPFSLDIIIREYLRFNGKTKVTTNWTIPEDWKRELFARGMEIIYLNLDLYVKTGNDAIEIEDKLQLADESVDFIICTHVIEHLYHPLDMLKEAYRVLKKNGKILISTDNAFMLATLFHVCQLNVFLHEPVEGTSAMQFHLWRGHNRFFSEGDLKTLLHNVGFRIIETNYHEVFYNSFNDEYFKSPTKYLPRWKADILTKAPAYRNELIVIAEK